MANIGVKSRQEARRIANAVRAVESSYLPGQPGGRWDGSYNTIQAKITGDDGAAAESRKYAWSQVRKTSTGTYETAGLSGTTTKNYATVPNGKTAATNDVVTLIRVAVNNGDGTFSASWVVVSTKAGGVDLKNNGTAAVTAAGSINIPSSSDVLVFGGSGDAGTLSLAGGTTAWTVLTWNGSKWVADFVRAHA